MVAAGKITFSFFFSISSLRLKYCFECKACYDWIVSMIYIIMYTVYTYIYTQYIQMYLNIETTKQQQNMNSTTTLDVIGLPAEVTLKFPIFYHSFIAIIVITHRQENNTAALFF